MKSALKIDSKETKVNKKDFQFVTEIEVADPDNGGPVPIEIWLHPNGGLFGIDSNYLDQVSEEIYDPFGEGDRVKLDLISKSEAA